MRQDMLTRPLKVSILGLTVTLTTTLGAAGQNVEFQNLAADPASGIAFVHSESPRDVILDGVKSRPFVLPGDLAFIPHKPHGAPGVAIFDHDRDGDLDVYATNSFGAANALFSNQLAESGHLSFIDVAAQAGVDALDHDSTGVCYGDIDNDGDHDLMVLAAIQANRLYENQGDGTFADITATAGVGGGALSTSSCSMGDVDGDGLLDIAVANTHTSWNDYGGIVAPFAFNEHNQLFVNTGGNVFADLSAASGFESLAGVPTGAATLTWAIALVDIDQDGDVDALLADDQGAIPNAAAGGVDYGFLHLLENDGSGQFTDRAVQAGLVVTGNWMGFSFGDFDCDGTIDFFATNLGGYRNPFVPLTTPNPALNSRWFLGGADGTFSDPGVGALVATAFGWGASTYDYDNDGDFDIVYHGAIDSAVFVDASNPGVILRNRDCSAEFDYDPALADSSDYARLLGQGLATGDLDGNGLVDVVTISSAFIPADEPLTPRSIVSGGPLDDVAFFYPVFNPDPAGPPGTFLWNGRGVEDGALTVEIADGDREIEKRGFIEVTLIGGAGQIDGGRVNRDGIGAVVSLETRRGPRRTMPVLGGASYASQDALTVHFGLGDERRGNVEVLWPGGTRNRLRGVRAGQRIVFPEIPCDTATAFDDRPGYISCVRRALEEWLDAGVIDRREWARFLASALIGR